jgi:hypothetical protein
VYVVIQRDDNAFVKVDNPVIATPTLKLRLALHLILGDLLLHSPVLRDRRRVASDHGLLVGLHHHHIIVFPGPLKHHAVIDQAPLWRLLAFCLLLDIRTRSRVIMQVGVAALLHSQLKHGLLELDL